MGKLTFDGRKKLEIDIMDLPAKSVVVISEEKAKVRELPEFVEYKIVTSQGKV